MMSDLVEAFKLVGAAGGLISTGFLIYDRLMRGRPEAFLSNGEYPGQLMVTLKNVSTESIILDEIAVAPNIVGIAEGNSPHAMSEISRGRSDKEKRSSRKVFIVLKPLEAKKFQNALGVQKVSAEFFWRTTRFRLPFKRNIKVTTSVADIRAMKQSAKSN